MMTFTVGVFEMKVLHHLSMRGCSEKKDAHFFSAFPHTDSVFGSNESFFMSDWKEHSGAWCVDPPFLTKHSNALTILWVAGEEGSPPILYIGPSRYKMQTPFDEEIRLYKDVHYYEGLDGLLCFTR